MGEHRGGHGEAWRRYEVEWEDDGEAEERPAKADDESDVERPLRELFVGGIGPRVVVVSGGIARRRVVVKGRFERDGRVEEGEESRMEMVGSNPERGCGGETTSALPSSRRSTLVRNVWLFHLLWVHEPFADGVHLR